MSETEQVTSDVSVELIALERRALAAAEAGERVLQAQAVEGYRAALREICESLKARGQPAPDGDINVAYRKDGQGVYQTLAWKPAQPDKPSPPALKLLDKLPAEETPANG